MDIALAVIVVVVVASTVVLVAALFVWAAVKDGDYDKAVQTRMRIRRRTRLGR
jgi:hypothetical protein